jgi:hypothetical protein
MSQRAQIRTRPWTDVERRAFNWNQRFGRPIKSMACARRDHASCGGVTDGPCACNCHFTWDGKVDLVRLIDGRVGLCLGVLKEPEYKMMVHLGFDTEIAVDIGEPVLLDQAPAP